MDRHRSEMYADTSKKSLLNRSFEAIPLRRVGDFDKGETELLRGVFCSL